MSNMTVESCTTYGMLPKTSISKTIVQPSYLTWDENHLNLKMHHWIALHDHVTSLNYIDTARFFASFMYEAIYERSVTYINISLSSSSNTVFFFTEWILFDTKDDSHEKSFFFWKTLDQFHAIVSIDYPHYA